MLYSAAAQVSFVALIAVTLFVLWAGDRWGRLSAVLHATNWVLVALFQQRHQQHLVFQTADFTIDLIGAVLACVIAAVCRRSWAAALAAFQLLGLINYFVVLLDHKVLHRAFWTAEYLWETGALISLIAAGMQGRKPPQRTTKTEPAA